MSAWEKNVRRVTPYVPGEQPREAGFIKLNTNENPYPPSPAVQRALEGAKASELRLYPGSGGDGSDGGHRGLSSCRQGAGVCRSGFRRCAGHEFHDFLSG